jgi:hypothetical protein
VSDPIRLLVFGLGYSAREFARRIKSRAEWIGGTARTAKTAERLRSIGVAPFVFDGTRTGNGIAAALAEATHILVSIPPGEGPDPVLAHHGDDIIAAPKLDWIGYLSTVGVYGDYGGAWVSERTTPHARPGRSMIRLEAERAWQDFSKKRRVLLAIFRIAGIYGPGRNALKNLDEGKARRIVKSGQVFNRIHVADIAATLEASIARPHAGAIYNVADDEPAPPQDPITFAAGLLGVDPPPEVPFERADLSPAARGFYGESKRVRNARIKTELGVRLAYPTYREGLTALAEDMR